MQLRCERAEEVREEAPPPPQAAGAQAVASDPIHLFGFTCPSSLVSSTSLLR